MEADKMTKQRYKTHILSTLGEFMTRHGYTAATGNRQFDKQQSADVTTSVMARVVTGKLPRSVIALDLDIAIRLSVVARTCNELVARSPELPTIWGPVGRFLSRDDFVSSYRFDWTTDDEPQFARMTQDLNTFFEFSESVRDHRDLDAERLGKIPLLRRNFAAGLGENYRYSLPEISVVLHTMNGRGDRARRALAIAQTDQSGRLDDLHIERLEKFVAEQQI